MPKSNKKSISLADACVLLEDCSAVIVDNVVTYPCLEDLDGDPDHEFLRLTWTDEEGNGFDVLFHEGKNAKVKLSGSDLLLVDADGDETPVTLLAPMTLKIEPPAPAIVDADGKRITLVVDLFASVSRSLTDKEISSLTVRLDVEKIQLAGEAGLVPATMIGYTTTDVQVGGYKAEDDSAYPREDWQAEVQNGDTKLGYREWVAHRHEAEEGQ
jgi:hypothetical protein